jgi:hypothetical protein
LGGVADAFFANFHKINKNAKNVSGPILWFFGAAAAPKLKV